MKMISQALDLQIGVFMFVLVVIMLFAAVKLFLGGKP